jgi:hypothetical protein
MKSRVPPAFVVAALLVSCDAASVGVSGESVFLTNASSADVVSVRRDEGALDVKPNETLDVETPSGNVEAIATDERPAGFEIEVSARGRTQEEADSALARYRVEVVREGTIVRLRLVGTPHEVKEGTNVWRFGASASMKVFAPKRSAIVLKTSAGTATANGEFGGADVASGAGTVEIAGAYGAVRAKTQAGSVLVRDVGAADIKAESAAGGVVVRSGKGTMSAKTSSGEVRVENWTGAVKASTGAGAVHVEGVLTTVEASSSAGSVEVVARPKSKVAAPWTIEASAGSVDFSATDALDADVEAWTSAGKVSSDFTGPETEERSDPKRWNGRLGGGGPSIRVSSSAGDVRIRRLGS